MSKHTPGPWKIRHREGWSSYVVYHPHKSEILPGMRSQPEICNVTEPTDLNEQPRALRLVIVDEVPNPSRDIYENKEIAKANAHLIAAAPELLSTLKVLVQRIDEKHAGKTEGMTIEGRDAYMNAKAAIAKAEGEEK